MIGRLSPARRWLAAGALVAAAAQLALPLGPPLYDGAFNVEPYRYLDPTGGHIGSPTSFAADLPVTDGRSPQITAATSETPPQAQLIALDGVFAVASGTTSVHVSITPVPPAAPLSSGSISGNVYRIEVTDPHGQAVPVAAGGKPTLAMRSAVPLADAAIFRLDNGSWTRISTIANAALSIYQAEPDALGDFAVVDISGGAISTTTVVIAATIGIVIAAVAIWAIRVWLRRRAVLASPPPRSSRSGGTSRSRPPNRRRR